MRNFETDASGCDRVCSYCKGEKNFDDKRLAKAIETRHHSYKLLMWISDAIDRGDIPPSRVAHHSGGPTTATQWLRENYFYIPEHLRPAERDINEFAAFFSTFLISSFDVVSSPGTKGEGPTPAGCQCELCVRIVNAPHLQAKKLYARDKKRADRLMEKSLCEVASEHGLKVSDQAIESVVQNAETRRPAAYVTYGHWLVRRLSGESDGPAVLALWRLIAWDPRGGMRRGFQLQLDHFASAKVSIVHKLQNCR